MPTGLVRIVAVAYCVLILLSASTGAAAHEAGRWKQTVPLMAWSFVLLVGGAQFFEKVWRPATLRVTRRGLVADQAALLTYSVMWLPAIVLGTTIEQYPWENATTLWIAVAAYVAGSVVVLVYRRPQLILTPEGVIVRRIRRTVRGGWDAVPWMSIPFDSLQPRHDFVEFAVGHYIANPAERAGMVGAVGLSRLKLAFAQHVDRLPGGRERYRVVGLDAREDGVART